MTNENEVLRNCFTVIWKLENASYSLQKDGKAIKSPSFTVGEIHETKWKLELDFSRPEIGFLLERQKDRGPEEIEVTCELAFLSGDGIVLEAYEETCSVEKDSFMGTYGFALMNKVFRERKSVFLPEDTLTTRCRIWKSMGEMSKDVQCFARTCIGVEKWSFVWNIERFSFRQPGSKWTYEIKSLDNGKELMTLELFLTGGIMYDETIHLKITPCRQNIRNSSLQVSIINASKNAVKCFQDEFLIRDPCDSKDFTLFHSKRELIEKKDIYLPNNVLTLLCECVFSFGIISEEINIASHETIPLEQKELDNCSLPKENDLPFPKSILVENLKSMLYNGCLSDVKLKTKSRTYPAHKIILGAQSPVFKAMFSTDMREKISDCVNIEDLNDNTVTRLLLYIYSAEVGELEWDISTDLYEAADKYQIATLKDICSSFLKSNLRPSNACKLLILADLHHDQDLKDFVQSFILRIGMDIIYSKEWERLMQINLKLAAETMRLKFKT